ncbi:MAG: twin-arginine translocation signal domain-containing protein [Chthonomonadaceae bacterium]|nr:twin-arginine translocation signal domain-containing protein [Chthonomonadaceae bacterium]
MSDTTISRRKALALAAGAAGAVATGAKLPKMSQEKPKASLKQSVCRWCFGGIALDDLCVAGKDMGLVGIDLLKEDEFATVKKHGLICTMALGITTIPDGAGPGRTIHQPGRTVFSGKGQPPCTA